MTSKVCTAAEAMADVHDGASIAVHSWGAAGTPGYLLRALVQRAVKDLTLYCNNFIPVPEFLAELGMPLVTPLIPQLKKIVSPFVGGRGLALSGTTDFLGDQVKRGQLEIEATTHGVFMERLHAGAMGLGGFYSPVGLNTIIERGKEKRVIDDKEYIFEKPIRPDVGLIKADKADKLGNLIYRGSSRGSNPIIAMASKLTIVEVFEVVEPGELDPEMVVTPGIYVDRIVRIPDEDVASGKRRPEIVKRLTEEILPLVWAISKGGQG